MPALPGSPSSLISAPRQELPTLGTSSYCQGSSESPDLWIGVNLCWLKWLFNPRAALRHSSGAASLSIYFLSFHSQGTGLLLSCGLLWKAMCCKFNISLSLDGTVTQFRVWHGGQDPKGGFPVLWCALGWCLPHRNCPTSEIPQQLSMLCSMHFILVPAHSCIVEYKNSVY